jgi:hypothetical protein
MRMYLKIEGGGRGGETRGEVEDILDNRRKVTRLLSNTPLSKIPVR